MRAPDDASRLAHLLWEVSARSAAFVEDELTDTQLTPASHGVLDVVATNPGTSIVEITRSIPTSVQAVSQIVGRLERRNFIRRRAGPRGRSVALYVTRDGEAAREAAESRLEDAARVLRSTMGAREHDELVRLLHRARERFDHLPGKLAARRL